MNIFIWKKPEHRTASGSDEWQQGFSGIAPKMLLLLEDTPLLVAGYLH